MNVHEEFLSDLMMVKSLRVVGDNAIDEWGEDIPATLLFAALGRGVVKQFDNFSNEERIHVFDVIERGMRSGNIDLNTYVATGLLESLYVQASGDAALRERIDVQLGEVSRKYLREWEEWHRA